MNLDLLISRGKAQCWEDPRNLPLLKDDRWFELYQPLLLRMVNTRFGRELLCVNPDYPQITSMRKESVTWREGHLWHSDIRIGAKWANVIRSRFTQFQSYARYFTNENPDTLSSLTRYARSVHALQSLSTFFPDPDAETTTVDGTVRRDDSTGWTNCHDTAAGTSSFDTLNLDFTSAEFVTGTRYIIDRNFLLFNTGPTIGSTKVVLNATINLHINTIENGLNDANCYTTIVGPATPASNTALGTADYNKCGAVTNPIKFSGDRRHDSITAGSYFPWFLETFGIGAIAKGSGVSKFGWRQGYDQINTDITSSGNLNEIDVESADAAGTSTDPFLAVTYADAADTVFNLNIS